MIKMNRDELETIITNIHNKKNIDEEILEKDYYVCLVLKDLSENQDNLEAYFKGGTAVYKILDHMNRFSEDIDLTVKVNESESGTSNRRRLKKSALGYKIDGLELQKEKTIDKKGSIAAFYKYDSLFNINKLFKPSEVQIESTSFTVSDPTEKYTIEPLIYKYANDDEKKILKEDYNISDFKIKIITLERIFIDKIFAAEFYYERKMYNDTSKHLYDITILSDNERIKKFLKNKKEQLRMIKYKREEEERRYGGIDKNKRIIDFDIFKSSKIKDIKESFENMEKIYVLDDKDIISIKDVNIALKMIYNELSKLY